MREVGPAILFSPLAITVNLLPIFTLGATEGRLLEPPAFTKTYAMGLAKLLATTLVPTLAALVIRGEERNPVDEETTDKYGSAVPGTNPPDSRSGSDESHAAASAFDDHGSVDRRPSATSPTARPTRAAA